MKSTDECVNTEERESHRVCTDDGGFALTWFAILLLVLIAMAGFGVDVWNWWYTSQKVQRAADAGALAGVTFLPANFNVPAAGPNAVTTATGAIKQNGFVAGGPVGVAVTPGSKSNQLDVTVTQTVDNIFTSLLGVRTTTISRKATAEFNAPIQMGSPSGHLANDPENGATDKHWLNIGAPNVDKHTGDRYADYTNCTSSYNCSGSTNNEFYDGTYVFTIDVPQSAAGQNIDVQVYDPEYATGNTTCNNQWLSPAQITTLQATYPDAATRYATGQTDWCTGDDDTNLGAGIASQATTWIVRDSQTSEFQALSNNIISTGGPVGGGVCAHQFKGYTPPATSPTYWFDLLNPAGAGYDSDFAASFHRWYAVCNITSAVPGKYFVQVRSSVPLGTTSQQSDASYLTKSESPPENTNIGGQNRYSLRVVDHGTSSVTTGVQAYAETHLPVYTNTTGANTPNFYLARLLPGGGTSGRKLHLVFYDIGDISGGTTSVVVSPPADATGAASTCTWTGNGPGGAAGMPTSTVSGCTVSGITSNNYSSGFNGVLVTADISVAGNYSCAVASPTGCWFKIQMSYTGGAASQANDTTTWDASIAGDPVRLVK